MHDKINDAISLPKDEIKADKTKTIANTHTQTHHAKYSDLLWDKLEAVNLV